MIELLLSLLFQATGITRTVDPALVEIAEARVIEITLCPDTTDSDGNPIPGSCFSHDGLRPATWEVLAWNVNAVEPYSLAVDGWRQSADHWPILINPSLRRIGCAHTIAHERDYFACVLAEGPAPVVPNTAMDPPAGNREAPRQGRPCEGANQPVVGRLFSRL